MVAVIDNNGKITVKDSGKTILSSPVEVLFLMEKERLEVFSADGNSLSKKNFLTIASKFDKKFEIKFIVYKDLRERGYRIKTGVMGLRLYPRGKKPGESESTHYIITISERDVLSVKYIKEQVNLARNLRKKLIIGVVDEDGEVTYYNIKEIEFDTKPSKKNRPKKPYHADFLEENVFIWDKDAVDDLFLEEYYGKQFLGDSLQLSLTEAAYLSEQGIIDLYKDNVKLTLDDFIDLCTRKVENFYNIFLVYRDLKEKGLTLKTGYKFGIDFRVYDNKDLSWATDRVSTTKIEHSKYLLQVFHISYAFKIPDMARSVRMANSVRKSMIFAGVDTATGNISYINISWTKL